MPFLGSVTPDHIPVPQEEGKGDKGGRDGQSKQNVLKMVKENDVKFIRLWFTDILGVLKGLQSRLTN